MSDIQVEDEDFQMNNLSDDVLEQIIGVLSVEHQFLLMRVCRRFSRLIFDNGSGTLTRVSKISGISEMLCVGNKHILKALKKLPNLVRIDRANSDDGRRGLSYGLEDRILNKLVHNNSNLIHFEDWSDRTIIRYIKQAKRYNGRYDESKIRHLFDSDCPIGNLKLKVQYDSLNPGLHFTDARDNICDVQIRFYWWLPNAALQTVTSINLYKLPTLATDNCQMFQNAIDSFPNLCVIDIVECENSLKIVPKVLLRICFNIKSLQQINITTSSPAQPELASPEWSEEDAEVFKQLVMKPTMNRITLNGFSEKSEHAILRAFMDCSRLNFKKFQINDLFNCDGFCVTMKGYSQYPISTILTKFKNVHIIQLILKRKVPLHAEGVQRALKECEEYSLANKRKQLTLQIETSKTVVHSFDF